MIRPAKLLAATVVMLAACSLWTASAPPILAQDSVSTLRQLQKERRALAARLSPSVVAVASQRPDIADAPNTGMAQGRAKCNSGFVVDKDYIISTFESDGALSVGPREVEPGDSVWLMNAERTEFTGKVVGKDMRNLMVLIKMDDGHPDLPSLKLGNSDAVEVGASCMTLGNSLDSILLDSTVTYSFGTVSGFYRFEPIGVLKPDEEGGDPYRGNVIESDAGVQAGDWGGPLCNLDGEVIGMMTRHWMTGRHLGTSVPANQLSAVLPQLKKGVKQGDLPQAWCGFKAKFEKEAQGIVITGVNKDGPGEKAGLKVGMILLRVDNYKIPNKSRLAEMLGKGHITRKVLTRTSMFERPRMVDVPVSYGVPIGTHILLTVRDPKTGKEKTVDLLTEQKADDF